MTEAPTVTLSMFWPMLMQAAENDYNPNAHAAIARLQARPGFDADTLSAEGVAEEMARQHFPSGTTSKAVGFYAAQIGFVAPNDGWSDDHNLYDTFEEMADGMAEAKSGPLSPTDPGHVAMVIRMLALSQSLPVYIEGPNVKFKHNDECPSAGIDHDHDGCGPGVTIRLERTRPGSGPASVGYFLAYLPGESAENFDVGAAVFRWMAERHAEIVEATKAQDEAESGPANVIKLSSA